MVHCGHEGQSTAGEPVSGLAVTVAWKSVTGPFPLHRRGNVFSRHFLLDCIKPVRFFPSILTLLFWKNEKIRSKSLKFHHCKVSSVTPKGINGTLA